MISTSNEIIWGYFLIKEKEIEKWSNLYKEKTGVRDREREYYIESKLS